MVTVNLPPLLASTLPKAKDMPIGDLFGARFFGLFLPILSAKTRRDLYREVDETVFEYVAFKMLLMPSIMEEISREEGGLEGFLQRNNQANWEALADNPKLELSSSDKRMILEVLKGQFEIYHLFSKAEESKKEFAAIAIVDGFRPLQGIDLCLTAILFIAQGYLKPGSPNTLHWLCLAMKRCMKEFEGAVFAYNPELLRRLSTSGQTISTEEMESRLGLRG